MPTVATLLILATLLPLASAVLLLFFARRIGKPVSGYFATLFIMASFICSMLAMTQWLSAGEEVGSPWGAGKMPILKTFRWLPIGIGAHAHAFLRAGIYIDSLTIAMFSTITLVAVLVHIFSIRYMKSDMRFGRYFCYLSLFCFSMLALVLGSSVLHIFLFWELVGICSYLLIGFWYEKKEAQAAAIKAFVVNRIGDIGFLIGLGMLFCKVGSTDFPHLWMTLGNAGLGGEPWLTLAGIGLFCGAIGKSAQFPLHVWLPDAMEGPTPVSALIHAATMVAAGVYLLARVFPILTPDAKLFIAIIGCLTLTFAALIAVVQSDIKKILAYSTISQLGYMIMAMGIGSWLGGVFHLITHAFFKSLLFLGAGSVIHSASHERELPQLGGLIRKLPVTAITFLVALLALAGTPGFSGFYSKEMILGHAAAFSLLGGTHGYWLFFILPVVVAYITPFYMMRCWMLCFWGKPRNREIYQGARESATFYLPLIVLAVLAVVGGSFLEARELLEKAPIEARNLCDSMQSSTANQTTPALFQTAWTVDAGDNPQADALVERGEQLVHRYAEWAFAAGIGLAMLIYFRGYAIAEMLVRFLPLRLIHTWLYRRMYFDELYFATFVALVAMICKLADIFDRHVIDGAVNFAAYLTRRLSSLSNLFDQYVIDGLVNSVAETAQNIGVAARMSQNGRIRAYVMALVGIVSLALAAMVIVMMGR
ncbi:MAG TPA: NADH-quinone oxidoreductase subunit L [Tepidisphaeraceae bacterium]|jgi:proton-translocating NADH-quinone oxidoreductase chain L